MLMGFVIVYLLLSILIGVYAATRVKNSRDYVVAGRHLPIYIVTATVFATWFGSETVLGISSTFLKEGMHGIVADPFGSSLCLILVGLFFAKPLYRMKLLTIGDFYKSPLQSCGGGRLQPVHHPIVPGLGLGADDRAWAGVQHPLGRPDRQPHRHRHRRGHRPALHPVRRHVVGGADRFLSDDHHHGRHRLHRLAGERHGRRVRQSHSARGGARQIQSFAPSHPA